MPEVVPYLKYEEAILALIFALPLLGVGKKRGSRLSPIIDSEDDCQQEDDSHLRKITLKYEVVDEFDMPPWIDSTDFPFNNPFRQKQPTNEMGIQCRPAHGPMIDKHLQTTYIDYEVGWRSTSRYKLSSKLSTPIAITKNLLKIAYFNVSQLCYTPMNLSPGYPHMKRLKIASKKEYPFLLTAKTPPKSSILTPVQKP
ncbi:hypothetical protein DdX_13310 [Ditylenchus destructor]|uniref:Uncharacterized protein n=1 Tax=Ditylenchus destructor TaxID=166010 RepID=A0AAD4MW90_9BILA|nr:hypothetical protein DdX_13310 [Ditylenchus destructor]